MSKLEKFFRLLDDLIVIVAFLLVGWVVISYFNVLAVRPDVPNWNFFVQLTKVHAESDFDYYSHLAEHEENKGVSKLPKYKQNGYTDYDLRLLSQIIFSESGYCSEQLQLYVGSVVINRTKDARFPNSIEGVVFQKGQYAPVGSKIWYQTPNKSSIQSAKTILSQGSVLPPNVVFQANFTQGKGIYCELETVYFCY